MRYYEDHKSMGGIFQPHRKHEKVITTMAKKAAEVLSVPMETFDFTSGEPGRCYEL